VVVAENAPDRRSVCVIRTTVRHLINSTDTERRAGLLALAEPLVPIMAPMGQK